MGWFSKTFNREPTKTLGIPNIGKVPRLPPDPIAIEKIVAGRYAIERKLGQGGFGIVYLARDLQLHAKPVVVKCLLVGDDQPAEWVMRKFGEEISALSAIDH